MSSEFSWYVSVQLQDWIVSKKPFYPNLEECISWVKDKLKRECSSYELTKEDIEDIEMALVRSRPMWPKNIRFPAAKLGESQAQPTI
tara:strand:+ start:140 stop:400 length:261 start_codon:yes stop_codon:yes gene_type:complete